MSWSSSNQTRLVAPERVRAFGTIIAVADLDPLRDLTEFVTIYAGNPLVFRVALAVVGRVVFCLSGLPRRWIVPLVFRVVLAAAGFPLFCCSQEAFASSSRLSPASPF